MNGWCDTTIGGLGRVVTGSTPPSKHPDWFGDDLPFVTPSDITFGNRRPRPERWLSQSGRDGLRTRVVPPGSSAFVCIGATIGKVCLVETEAITNQQINTVIPAPDTDSRFLYSLLRHVAPAVAQGASGAATPIINKSAFSAIPVRIPDLETQVRIGEVLGALDDLIENNGRRVEILEEMARAIYREWFVQFRYPGHEDVPLVDSALGPIPEGWVAGKVGQLCLRVQAGATPRRSTPEYWAEPSVDWYKTGDLTDGVLIGSSEKLSNAGLKAGRTFEPETILMAIYGSPTVGRLGLLTSLASANQAALGLVANPEVSTTEHLWFTLETLREHLNQIAQGAAQQNVSKEKVIGCDAIIPPREVLEDFTRRAAPTWRLSHELARQAAVLESLRDHLLPKLVTGEIDVSALNLDALLAEQVAQ